MITFTTPPAFREFFRSHQRFAYSAFFEATSGTMRKLASEHTYFPGDISGFFGVLHTWGRQMNYHPHIHYIVPGGAFNSNDHSWHSSNKEFYLPIRVMSKLVKHRIYIKMKKRRIQYPVVLNIIQMSGICISFRLNICFMPGLPDTLLIANIR